MKKLLGIIILGLFLIPPSQADDIATFDRRDKIADDIKHTFNGSTREKIILLIEAIN
jgi:hypothetical protein